MLRFAPLLLLVGCAAQPQQAPAPNVFLITYDGLRWEEVYTGIDSVLMSDERYTSNPRDLADELWHEDPEVRRENLLPFLWSTIATDGVLLGNRMLGSEGNVTNGRNFSYPGYNEMLAGQADDRIDSNDMVPNPNVTVLEWLNGEPGFEGRVAAFGSWNVFPAIINEERSGVPVNAGFETAAGPGLTERELFLNELQPQVPSPWGTVRLDAFTHHYAKEYLQRARPRVLYVAYGETDDFAHDGDYDAYIHSARKTDDLIRDLWEWAQATEGYRDNTTIIITTDHGRGPGDRWIGHGVVEDWPNADQIWFAAIGPGIAPLGESGAVDFRQEQVAATVARAVGKNFEESVDVAVGRPAGAIEGIWR